MRGGKRRRNFVPEKKRKLTIIATSQKKKGTCLCTREKRERLYYIPFQPFLHPRARDFVNVLTAFNIPVHSLCSASSRGPFKRDDRCLARDRHAHDSSRVALDIQNNLSIERAGCRQRRHPGDIKQFIYLLVDVLK